MPIIINWPSSQVCTDCKHAHWLMANQEDDIIYPASVCNIELYPIGPECSKWQQEYETIELIAAGYEWICPTCDLNNKEIEVNETVQCKSCERQFEVADHEHAYQN
jgi:hypothetical protein